MAELYAGIESGGTKWICIVAEGPERIIASTRFPTSQPAETLATAIKFLQTQIRKLGKLKGLGIGSFGPLDLNPDSETYGYVTTTPKPGWGETDLVSPFKETFDLPIGLDTDVNAAALGESQWGAAQGLKDFIYLTIGTGIGGGGLANGDLIHGLLHPEMGHIRVPHDYIRDPFAGVCPYHGDCLEGLATGPAIEVRWGQRGENLPVDHPAWELEAYYLALGLVNLICILSPQRIILGGGVMEQAQLFPLIRKKVLELLNNYISAPQIIEGIDYYIVPPRFGTQAGVMGALALAQRAAADLI